MSKQHANFTPNLEGYSGLQPFKFWCQHVLPLTYDDSLSYYELLCRVVNYINNIIEDLSKSETNIENLLEAYKLLQKYVNDYFDNLDINTEINEKLDEMAVDGSLSRLIQPFIQNSANPLVASSTSGMSQKDRIYLNTSDGYLYYWNGNAWQTTGLKYGDTPSEQVFRYVGNLSKLGITSFADCTELGFYDFSTAYSASITDKPDDLNVGGVIEIYKPWLGTSGTGTAIYQMIVTTNQTKYYRYGTTSQLHGTRPFTKLYRVPFHPLRYPLALTNNNICNFDTNKNVITFSSIARFYGNDGNNFISVPSNKEFSWGTETGSCFFVYEEATKDFKCVRTTLFDRNTQEVLFAFSISGLKNFSGCSLAVPYTVNGKSRYQDVASVINIAEDMNTPITINDDTTVYGNGHTIDLCTYMRGSLVDENELKTFEYATKGNNDYVQRVFVDKSLPLFPATDRPKKAYYVTIFNEDTHKRLEPKATIDEVKETLNSFTYENGKFYINCETDNLALNDTIAGRNGITVNGKDVKIVDLTVKGATQSCIAFNGGHCELDNVKMYGSSLYMGLSLEDNVNGTIRNCEAKYNGVDGFNIHGDEGVNSETVFINCVGSDNLDDGISHHNACGGMIIGGEYSRNGKMGVASPGNGTATVKTIGTRADDNVVAGFACGGTTAQGYFINCFASGNVIGIENTARVDTVVAYILSCWLENNSRNDTEAPNGGTIHIKP